jgi:hypothetical protein
MIPLHVCTTVLALLGEWGLANFLSELPSNCDPPHLCLLCSSD